MKTILGSRRDQSLARLSIFLIMAVLLAGTVDCVELDPACEDLEIWDWYDLDSVRYNPRGHHRLMNDLDSTTLGYEELAGPTANQGKGWEPIRGRGWPYRVRLFSGTLDGQGYEIRDLFVNRPCDAGLFALVSGGGVIRNVHVLNATLTNDSHAGGLAIDNSGSVSDANLSPMVGPGPLGYGILVARNDGTVTNCSASGSVGGDYDVGGVVGQNCGTVTNSYFSGSVSGEWAVGSLVGYNWGAVGDSYVSSGIVTGAGGVGGLVGASSHSGAVSNSYYNYHEVLINGQNMITIGALFGEDFDEWLANGMFLDVNERLSQEDGYYLIDDVDDFRQLLAFGQDGSLRFRLQADLDLGNDPGLYIPYLAGELDGNGRTISNLNLNLGSISRVGLVGLLHPHAMVKQLALEKASVIGSGDVGGLVGDNLGTVSNCCSSGNVTGDSHIGGLVGLNAGTVNNSYSVSGVIGGSWVGGLVGWNRGTVAHSYSSGHVTGESIDGGLVGSDWDTIGNSFWDVQTSGMEESAGGTGKTTAEMMDIATFTDTESEGLDDPWDIIAVGPGDSDDEHTWNIIDGETYPFLSWQPV
jgi:methylglyoxal synthase